MRFQEKRSARKKRFRGAQETNGIYTSFISHPGDRLMLRENRTSKCLAVLCGPDLKW
jgi:hypothetical protein